MSIVFVSNHLLNYQLIKLLDVCIAAGALDSGIVDFDLRLVLNFYDLALLIYFLKINFIMCI